MSDNLIFFGAIVVFLIVFCVALNPVLKKAKRIDKEGIETDAVVSRVEQDLSTPDSPTASTYTYVQFTDQDGVSRESVMTMSADVQYEQGDHVRIKYIPGEYDMVRPA